MNHYCSNLYYPFANIQSFPSRTKEFANIFDENSLIPRKRKEIKNTRHSSGWGCNTKIISNVGPDE